MLDCLSSNCFFFSLSKYRVRAHSPRSTRTTGDERLKYHLHANFQNAGSNVDQIHFKCETMFLKNRVRISSSRVTHHLLDENQWPMATGRRPPPPFIILRHKPVIYLLPELSEQIHSQWGTGHRRWYDQSTDSFGNGFIIAFNSFFYGPFMECFESFCLASNWKNERFAPSTKHENDNNNDNHLHPCHYPIRHIFEIVPITNTNTHARSSFIYRFNSNLRLRARPIQVFGVANRHSQAHLCPQWGDLISMFFSKTKRPNFEYIAIRNIYVMDNWTHEKKIIM